MDAEYRGMAKWNRVENVNQGKNFFHFFHMRSEPQLTDSSSVKHLRSLHEARLQPLPCIMQRHIEFTS